MMRCVATAVLAGLGGLCGCGWLTTDLAAEASDDRVRVQVMNLNGPVLVVSAPTQETVDARLRAGLRQRVSVAFHSLPVSDAAAVIARRAGVNVVIDPRVLADDPLVDLQLTDVTAA